MEIHIKNLQKKIILKPTRIKNLIRKVLKNEGVDEAELSVVFVSAQKIRALNCKYLNHHYVTDVITFDTSDQFSSVRGQLEGEIFISTDAARQNARLHKTTEDNELTLYIVHGILHLLGYDDHSKNDIKKMRDKEIQVMTYL